MKSIETNLPGYRNPTSPPQLKTVIKMNEKTFLTNQSEFYNLFTAQFETAQQRENAWQIVNKPKEYPCVAVKSCGKYIFVYLTDMDPFINCEL